MKLHHVGIVMKSREAADRFMEKFDLELDEVGYMETYHSDCLLTKHAEGVTAIELVVPVGGVLASYNNGKGGIHHIAFEVDDVAQCKLEYEAKGLEMLEDAAVEGLGNLVVNFLRPKYGEGILVEFVQKKEERKLEEGHE